jgi:hypothetical protein
VRALFIWKRDELIRSIDVEGDVEQGGFYA